MVATSSPRHFGGLDKHTAGIKSNMASGNMCAYGPLGMPHQSLVDFCWATPCHAVSCLAMLQTACEFVRVEPTLSNCTVTPVAVCCKPKAVPHGGYDDGYNGGYDDGSYGDDGYDSYDPYGSYDDTYPYSTAEGLGAAQYPYNKKQHKKESPHGKDYDTEPYAAISNADRPTTAASAANKPVQAAAAAKQTTKAAAADALKQEKPSFPWIAGN